MHKFGCNKNWFLFYKNGMMHYETRNTADD